MAWWLTRPTSMPHAAALTYDASTGGAYTSCLRKIFWSKKDQRALEKKQEQEMKDWFRAHYTHLASNLDDIETGTRGESDAGSDNKSS